nr:hypothetical protein [Octadecabacter antarcticus]
MTEGLKETGLDFGHRRVGRPLSSILRIDCRATDAPEWHICG